MPDTYIRFAFIFCHIFIQVLWTSTSRGRNVESFLKTWMHVRSIPIVMFEFIGFGQVLFPARLAFPIQLASLPDLQMQGLMISVIGVVFASWAKITMKSNWGRPAQHDKKIQSHLVTSGPFSFSRNPIYVGLFLLFLGQQIALQSYGILMSFIFAIAILQAVTREEKLLERYFGKAYSTYQKRIPRFL